VIGLLRYTLSDTFHSQGWVAPVVSLGAIDAIISAQTGSLLPTFAILATALLFVSTWLTVVIVNNEDPIQLSITETCAGSRSKVRLSKLLFSYLMAVMLGLVAMMPPIFIARTGSTARVLIAGICGLLIAALAGVSLGALCSRPVIRRRAWSVLLGVVVCLGTILLPSGIPSRQLLVLFNKTGQFALALPLALIALETLVLCAVGVIVSLRLSLRRS
jgi:hypothetical protein